MSESLPAAWYESNQRYLARAIAEVRCGVERVLRGAEVAVQETGGSGDCDPMPADPAIETLCSGFELSSFERKILLMCAGAEMDSRFAELYRSTGNPQPTFALALAAFEDAHWSALSPDRPLRHWRLIDLKAGETLTSRPLAIDERILHYLAGVQASDERLLGFVRPAPVPESLAPSHRSLAEKVADLWSYVEKGVRLPAVVLSGEEPGIKTAIAAHASAMLGLRLHTLAAWSLPQGIAELDTLLRSWEREAVLGSSALLLECGEVDHPATSAITWLIETVRSPLILSTRRARWPVNRRVARFDVGNPTAIEQADLWRTALEPRFPELNGEVETLVAQFSLNAASIHSAAQEVTVAAADTALPAEKLWDACRMQSRPRLEGLAQRIEPTAAWDDLVLPAPLKQILAQIEVHVRRRKQVYGDWGFDSKGSRGLGISALFAGPSGTGKTMAAEVLANDLRLDLFRIDLSQVVSKYIGETEKNLRRIFDAAEEGAAVLLFDEADALFGKRTEVKDSHDRYANIEVSYLLQRMEEYRGLAILTTNRKSALDQAFLRRIRFIVTFPFPEPPERAEIWRRVFPGRTPTDGLLIDRLARLNAAGGSIRNIAMGAAFLAADRGEPVRMSHLLTAAQHEFAKMERPLTDGEVAGWL